MAEYLTVDEVAAWLRVSRQSLYHWHSHGGGPPCQKVAGRLRYTRAGVEKWVAAGAPTPPRPRGRAKARRGRVRAASRPGKRKVRDS